MSSLEDRYYAKKKDPEITARGVGEAALSMATGMGGAFAGTVAGVTETARQGDVFAFTPAFEAVASETNKAYQYQPKTPGGQAAIEAFEELWKEHVSDPTEKYLVEPNLDRGNPLMAAIGKAGGEGLAMFAMLRAGVPAKVAAKGTVSALKSARELTNPLTQKLRSKSPAAKEVLVDLETGKPVITPDLPLSDKGSAFTALREAVRLTKDPATSPHEGVQAMLKPLFYKPVQVLRDWGSPTLNKMADYIYAPTKADAAITTPRGVDLIEATSKAQGKWGTAVMRVIEPHRGRIGLPKAKAEAITRGLRTGKVPENLRQATSEMRDFYDAFLGTYVRPVLDTGKVENFVPQVWLVPKIQRAPGRFKAFAKDVLGFDDAAAENFMRRVVENEGSPEMEGISSRLTNPAEAASWGKRVMHEGGASKSGSLEHSRRIHLTEEQLPFAEEWLDNNILSLTHTYLRNATKRVEYARTMGASEGKLNYAVAKAIKELGIENKPESIQKLTTDVYSLADALQGKYKPIKSLSAAKWNRRLANYETVLHLGLVSLASFPELAAPAIQFGFVPTAYAKGTLHALLEATGTAERLVTGRRAYTPKLRSAEALESLGAISLTTLQSGQAARFSSVGTPLTSKFMHATGLELLTDIQRVIAYESLSAILARNAKALSKGDNKFYREQLIELGVDPKQAVEWHKQGAPKEGPLADVMENAKLRGQRWAVTMPNPATRPLIFSDPHWANVVLFKSFTGVFSNLFMKRAVKELMDAPVGRKASVVGGMTAATAIAYYTQFLREFISGHKNTKDDLQRTVDAFDRAALTGPFTYGYMLASPYRFGFMDSGSKRLFNLAGPAVGDAAKTLDILTNADMSKKRRADQMAKLIPVVNITKPGREAAAEIIKEGL